MTIRSVSHWGAFRAQVENGRLVGVAPFEHDPNPSDLIAVWPEMVTSPLRVAAPAVRRGWLDGDGGLKRGDDTFVRVDWGPALDLAAGAIERVRADHGNQAIFGGSYGWSSAGRIHHARNLLHRFLNCAGGYTGQVTNYSYGAAMAFLPRVLGVTDAVGASLTSWDSIAAHCDIFLAFGGIAEKNWAIQSGGAGQHLYADRMKALDGAKVQLVNISPLKGDVPERYRSQWLPIRPNTDTALLLALAYQIVSAGRHDAAFLTRYCVGFERFESYLRGQSDGVPKTPQWASGITGVPAAKIIELANALPGKRVLLSATWSLQRARHGEQPYWAIVALAAILGQIGLPGGGFAFGYGSSNGMGNPRYDTPLFGLPVGENPVKITIPVARMADLLLNAGETISFNGKSIVYPDVRLVYWAGGNPFHHHQDLNRLRRAFKKPETVIVNEPYWTSTARHADIVFPATTPMERNDIGGASRDPFILAMHKAVEPVGQARNDFDIFAALSARLGTHDAFTGGKSEADWLHEGWHQIGRRLAARGISTPDFDSFWQTGYFRLPEPSEPYVIFGDYRRDPERTRLSTPSGRIELFSESVAAMNDPEQPGHPAWIDPEEWLGAPLAGRFPLHLMTPQPARRLHGQMDASSISRANKRNDREVVLMHPGDAQKRGIADGTIVRLFNERGACLASAQTSADLLPGVVWLATGATYDPDERGFDRHSNPNVLTRDIGTSRLGQGCSAQSCLIEIARFDGEIPPVRVFDPPAVGEPDPGTPLARKAVRALQENTTMPQQFDHLVLLVHDAARAAEDFRGLGFKVVSRADVGAPRLENRFVCFADGSYFLLTSFADPAVAQKHRLAPVLAAGEGWADYSLLVPHVEFYQRRLAAAGQPVADPVAVGNKLADGSEWNLSLLMTGRGVGHAALPFLVEDRAGRQHRIPSAGATTQPFGIVGISGLTVLTRSLSEVEESLEIVYGKGRRIEPGRPETSAALRFEFGRRWVDVLQVQPGSGELGRYVAERGGGLFEAHLTQVQGAAGPEGDILDIGMTHGARITFAGPSASRA